MTERSTSDAAANDAQPDVHGLRRRWKPAKERLLAARDGHPTHVRFHRACSWLQCVEQMPDEQPLDLVLVCRWIAFNALYGQWDESAGEPRPDRECWRHFLDRIRALDREGRIAATLTEHKKLVFKILDDAYLAPYFWEDPSTERALRTTKERRNAPSWYVEQRWGMILERVVDRIYLLRCQLLHGAATYQSRANRTSLDRANTMLGHLLPAILSVWIDHGENEDWGPMCYPPPD